MFDICIPSWNSLPYLKLCVSGLNQNSAFPNHKIYVHDNGSTDGTHQWCIQNKIIATRTSENVGFCGVNHALKAGNQSYVVIFNTDMWPLPGWDLALFSQINAFKRAKINKFTLSCCLIEPTGNNPEYDIVNFGENYQNFRADDLLADFKNNPQSYMKRPDTIQYSHPILLPRAMLTQIGYLDETYFPGWSVDHDLAATAYFSAGCREFRMLGKSRVYHFSSKTFQQLPDDIRARHGQDIFQKKWNISADQFRNLIGIRNVIA